MPLSLFQSLRAPTVQEALLVELYKRRLSEDLKLQTGCYGARKYLNKPPKQTEIPELLIIVPQPISLVPHLFILCLTRH